jgi:hypothetical protein
MRRGKGKGRGRLTQLFSIYTLCSATKKSFEETFLRWFWHFTLKIKLTQHIVVVLTGGRESW